jgi:ketosteroid isomerase-like protein
MNSPDQNRQLVESYWDHYFRKDWKKFAGFFTADANYTDVGVDPIGAIGPAQIIARLRMGIDPTSSYEHLCRHIIAQGNLVVTEHVEVWGFKTGERFEHPFVSVMELRDGKIARWHDYSHAANIFNNAPAWWLEHVRKGWRHQVVPIEQL